jgi:hypothetical protein
VEVNSLEYKKFYENKDEILSKYFNDGFSAKELSKQFGFNRCSFKFYIERNGLKTRGRGNPTKRQIDKAKNYFIKEYGVINPGQLYHPNKSKKISDLKKKNNAWVGKNNPNYGNKIGKNNGFKGGKREDIENIFFRSSWEANIARILKFFNIRFIYETNHFPINNKQ